MSSSKHSELILDQFTRQAVPFATAPSIKDEAALKLVVEFSGAGPADTTLDVACGPGLIVVAFAYVVKHATGIDITPAMLERATAHAAEQGVSEEEALKKGMEAKSKEFVEKGAELYAKG